MKKIKNIIQFVRRWDEMCVKLNIKPEFSNTCQIENTKNKIHFVER